MGLGSYIAKGFDDGTNLNFFAYPTLWAAGLGWTSLAWRNVAAGLRVGRKPWRYAGLILGLDYTFKYFDDSHGYFMGRKEDELRRRVLIEKEWIEKRIAYLEKKSEEDPEYLMGYESAEQRPKYF